MNDLILHPSCPFNLCSMGPITSKTSLPVLHYLHETRFIKSSIWDSLEWKINHLSIMWSFIRWKTGRITNPTILHFVLLPNRPQKIFFQSNLGYTKLESTIFEIPTVKNDYLLKLLSYQNYYPFKIRIEIPGYCYLRRIL